MPCPSIRLVLLATVLLFFGPISNTSAVIRDGGVDPNNLGQGGWLYVLNNSTNRLEGSVSSVTNINSLFAYLKGEGMTYVIVKAATSNVLWSSSGANVPIGSPSAAFTSNLVDAAHANGLLIYGSIRSWGKDIPGEIAVADYVYQQGGDGFIIDAETEWESSEPWIGTNGPTLAWQLCSTIRAHWPNKFLAHNPYDTLYLHSSFPYREFGYWCDVVIPQVYHHSASQGNAIAAIHWTDVNYQKFQDSLSNLAPSVINGETIYWTNAIKPLALMRDVYNGNDGTPLHPDQDVANFLDYLVADPNCVTEGGYQGSDYFRSELHTSGQWANIKAATVGRWSNVVNNIVIDDASATQVGSWTMVKTIDATTGSTVTFSGETGTDTNSFGTNYWRAPQGTGSSYIQFTPSVLSAGEYKFYQWHPTRSDASVGVPITVKYDGGTALLTANQQTNPGNWSLLGKLWFAAGTNNFIRFLDNIPEASGSVLVDGLKMVFVPPVAVPPTSTGLSASAISSAQINLSWNDTATNETGFVIFRSTTSGGPYSAVGRVTRNVAAFSDINLNGSTTYYYVVRGTNYLGLSAISSQASATTLGATPTAPSITSHPQNQNVIVGNDATFSVTASGSPAPVYQWRFNTTNIAGATDASYTVTNAQPANAGNYSVVVTNASGSATSSNALLAVSFVPPSITAQPQSQSLLEGQTATFSVSATGTSPLLYQWRFNGSTLSGATLSSVTLSNATTAQAGNYSVGVTNGGGGVISSNATLSVNSVFKAAGWTRLWQQGGGSQTYLASSGHTERGVAYNPVSNRVLLISRASGTRIVVLDGDTGAYLYDLTQNATITGGTYSLSMISVAADGAVYAGNLTTAGNATAYRLYRWADDSSTTTPTLAFSGDPGAGSAQRWGDTLDVRGSGTNTQAIIASRSGTLVSVLTTGNGTTFSSTLFNVSGVEAGAFGLGVSFGANNTFWGKSTSLPLRQVSFNTSNGTSAVLRTHGTNSFPGLISPIGVEPSLNLLVGLNVSNPDTLQLFDLTVNNSTPSLIATTNFATANANTFNSGAIDFVGQRVYALDSNNGLLAMQLVQAAIPPSITAQPQNQTVTQASYATFSVSVAGTAPFSYQWKWNGTNISTGTQSSYTKVNVQSSDAGNYSVTVTNPGGVTNSASAALTVNVPPTLTTQPVSQVVQPGTNVIFTAAATGTEPLVYQWNRNGTNISTGSTLVLANVQTNDAGIYTVVVTNIAGAVVSSNANLNIKLPFVFQSPVVGANGQVHLYFAANSGSSYAIERSTNLIQWDPVTNVVVTNGVIELIDNGVTNLEKAFYRARE